jgi:glutaminyl-peptide cyclotransferase
MIWAASSSCSAFPKNPSGVGTLIRRIARVAAIFCASIFTSCGDASKKTPPAPTPEPALPAVVSADLWKQFSGEKALAEVLKQVDFGPRPSGSAALEKARGHILATLAAHGWEGERQEFDHTPVPGRGNVRYANIIARFPATARRPAPRTTQQVIIGSHYDTKWMPGIRFVGANDAGSSTGALLELARVLATEPAFATRFELVFFDGEEAVVEFSDPILGPDGLVGSRHYAKSIRDRARQYRFALVWDMIGDKNLGITLPSDSPKHLAGSLFTAAEQLGFRKYFGYFHQSILDDHVPIAHSARVPAMDIIDFDFPAWHTSGDTLDQLSAESLEIVGRVTLKMLLNEIGGK